MPTNAPMLILAEEKDDYTWASHCVKRVKKLKADGQNVSLKIYPSAYHGWINKFVDTFLPDAWHFNKCGLGWIDDDGFTYALDGAFKTRDMDWGTFFRRLAGTCGERGTTNKYQEAAFNPENLRLNEHLGWRQTRGPPTKCSWREI